MSDFVGNFLYSFGSNILAIIRMWRISGCITIWVLFWFSFMVLFRCMTDCLTPVLYQSGAFLFQKSLRIRCEVLGYPTRITSKISALLFGARARLALPIG